MIHDWIFQKTTPSGGQCYHDGRFVKIMYRGYFKIWEVPEGLPICAGNGELIEDSRIEEEK